MKRKIVDYSKLNSKILGLVIETYPNGFTFRDILEIKNSKEEIIKAVEIRTEDTIYLVKVGKKLIQSMEEYVNDIDEDIELNDFDLGDDDMNQKG